MEKELYVVKDAVITKWVKEVAEFKQYEEEYKAKDLPNKIKEKLHSLGVKTAKAGIYKVELRTCKGKPSYKKQIEWIKENYPEVYKEVPQFISEDTENLITDWKTNIKMLGD